MKYKITLLLIIFLVCILFFYNNLSLLNLSDSKEKILFELSIKNKNIQKFRNNLDLFKEIIRRCIKYDYESFSKICLILKEKNFIKDLNIVNANKKLLTDQYLSCFGKIFNLIPLEINFSAEKEEFITNFIDELLSNRFFVYNVNNCIIWKKSNKYHAQLKMNLFIINFEQNMVCRDLVCISKKDYPLNIIDRRLCYTGLIKAGLYKRIYINDSDISECFSKNTKFSLTKCTDSFIILHVNKLKKDLQLFLGKEGYIYP